MSEALEHVNMPRGNGIGRFHSVFRVGRFSA